MVIHNATFIVKREDEQKLIEWLKEFTLGVSPGLGTNPRISVMREAGGVRAHEGEAASVAYQMEFPDEKSAKAWNAEQFNRIADTFVSLFGADAMAFTSLFEVV